MASNQRGGFRQNDRMRDNTMSRDAAQQQWLIIKDAIQKIYDQQASQLSYEELYRTAYNLVLHKHGDMLYENVKKTTLDMLEPIAKRLLDLPDDVIDEEITKVWDTEKYVIIMIKDILLYMDKNFVPKQKNLDSVETLQTKVFKSTVVQNSVIKKKLVTRLLHQIEKERKGEMIQRQFIRKCVDMFIEVGGPNRKIYELEFENELIKQTRDFYRHESQTFISENACNAYLIKANNRYNEEKERVENYLHASSMDKILNEFLNEYIDQHSQHLLNMQNSGLTQMIQQDQVREIKLMFSLFKKIPNALEQFKNHFKAYIISEGQKLVRNDQVTNDELVRKIIEFQIKMDMLWVNALERDSSVHLTIKTSFEAFINENEKTAFSLVAYLDDQFKRDFKTNNEIEISEKIDKIIKIFRFLQDKDIFENHYRNSFSRRLLDSRRVLEDAEKEVIKKLKDECGFNFTQRLEVMFKDIKQSEQRTSDFKESVGANLDYDLSVKVLTIGQWPNENRDPTQ